MHSDKRPIDAHKVRTPGIFHPIVLGLCPVCREWFSLPVGTTIPPHSEEEFGELCRGVGLPAVQAL